MEDSTREMCGVVMVRKNPQRERWNDLVKLVAGRKGEWIESKG